MKMIVESIIHIHQRPYIKHLRFTHYGHSTYPVKTCVSSPRMVKRRRRVHQDIYNAWVCFTSGQQAIWRTLWISTGLLCLRAYIYSWPHVWSIPTSANLDFRWIFRNLNSNPFITSRQICIVCRYTQLYLVA